MLPTANFMKIYKSGAVVDSDRKEHCILKQGKD